MKKITFLLFTIVLITFKTAAQDSKIKFGVQGGLNYSSFRGYENYADNNPGFAYLFGASFQYQIKENLSLKVDINFEKKKSDYKVYNRIDLFKSHFYPRNISCKD
jgi:hypothetical protein